MTAAPSPDLTPELKRALVERLTALADDELVLGHRDSEWTGHAPILEEDIAIANVAQDEIGHAILWYGLIEELTGAEPDALAYGRGPAEFRSSALVEQPRGDWAFTMLRQFLFDAYEAELLPRLVNSAYAPVAAVAAKVQREELFHLRHSALWLERLAQGTDESRRRLLGALDALWPLTLDLLRPLPGDALLAEAGIYPAASELAAAVMARLEEAFARAAVPLPSAGAGGDGGPEPRTSRPDGHLAELLQEMQSVARADAAAEAW